MKKCLLFLLPIILISLNWCLRANTEEIIVDSETPIEIGISWEGQEEIQPEINISEDTCIVSDNVTIYTYMYHYIRDREWDKPTDTFLNNAVITQNFEAQMEKFQQLQKDGRLQIIFLSELEDFQTRDCYPHENLVIFTADDGWDDNFTNLFPIAKKHEIKFHLSIVSDFTHEPRHYNFITPSELKTINENPYFEIIWHTYQHLDLRNLNDFYLSRELCESKDDLEKLLDISINTIIYPAGKYNQTVINKSKECGYTYGFTTEWWTSSVSDLTQNPHTLKRIRVSRHSTVVGLSEYFEN